MTATPAAISEPRLFLITGIMAAGKSTVAQALAERFPRSVHVRGDGFRRAIVRGRVEMSREPSAAAWQQLRLRYELAVSAAKAYFGSGFTVVHQDVVLGGMLAEVAAMYRPLPLHLVVLCPRAEVVAAREASRPKRGYDAFSVADLDRELRVGTPRIGLWLDTSELGVEASVDAIFGGLDSARIES